jgi:hypothetical protein
VYFLSHHRLLHKPVVTQVSSDFVKPQKIEHQLLSILKVLPTLSLDVNIG